MFGFFRKRREHPHRRELYGLMSCLVAWRRALLEAYLRDGVGENASLEERRAALAGYA